MEPDFSAMPPISPLCTSAAIATQTALSATNKTKSKTTDKNDLKRLKIQNHESKEYKDDDLNNDNTDTEDLKRQIQSLRSIINTKTVQLNMVIQRSEEKYRDIHSQYRTMANELHDSWKGKHQLLEQENQKLRDTLTFILKRKRQNGMANGQSDGSHSHSDSINNLSIIGDFGEVLNDDVLSMMFGGLNAMTGSNRPRKSASSNSTASSSSTSSSSQLYID